MELVHHAVVDQLRIREVDDNIVLLAQADVLDGAAEGYPIGEDRRFVGRDHVGVLCLLGDHQIGLQNGSDRHTVD